MIPDLFRFAVSNLLHRRLRSWLTVLGIIIGVVAIVSLLSLSRGLQEAVEDEFAKFGIDKLIIQPANVGFGAVGETSAKLRDSDVRVIERVRGVNEVNTALFRPGNVKFENQVKFPMIVGLDLEEGISIQEDYGLLDVEEGRSLKKGDELSGVIGYNLRYGSTFNEPVRVGKTLLIEGREVSVVGVAKKIGDPGIDSGIMMNLDAVATLLDLPDQYDAIYVRIDIGEEPSVVAERIKRALRSHRNVEERKEDFLVQTSEDIQEQLFGVLNIIFAVLVGVALISLLVGSVGIMNTMYTAVLERTNEIGILKATGAPNGAILGLFVMESGLLGVVGGLAGLVIGYGISSGIAFVAGQALGSTLFRASFPLSWALMTVFFSFLIGALSGLLPSWQASKLKPVDALRY